MRKFTISVAVGMMAALLSACNTVPALLPDPGSDSRLTVKDVVDHISCELWRADQTWENNHAKADQARRDEFSHYLVTILLTLQVDDSIDVTPSLSYTNVLPKPATSVVTTLNADLGGARRRTFTTTYVVDVSKLDKTGSCPSRPKEKPYNLGGNLGINEIVADGLEVRNEDPAIKQPVGDPTDKSAPTFGSLVQFVVTRNLSGLGPVWTLKYFKGPAGAGGLINGKRMDTDSVLFTFAPQYVANTAALAQAKAAADAMAAAAKDDADRAERESSARASDVAVAQARTTQLGSRMALLSVRPNASSALAAAQRQAALQQQQLRQAQTAAAMAAETASRLRARADAAELDRRRAAIDFENEASEASHAQGSAVSASKDLMTTMLLQNLAIAP
jgi:hypothetical protein